MNTSESITALSNIEAFLYREADCLDRADLDAWMNLYTDDGVYWMPASPNQADPDSHISIFNDGRLLMEIRRRNFGHEFAASMEYDVRCSHLIGNVRIIEGAAADDAVKVASNFQAVMYYRGNQTLFAGRYTHELVRDGDELKIHRKRVDLINCDSSNLRSIVIYL